MFTGIITDIGTIARAVRGGGGVRFSIDAPASAKELRVNDSVSVSGVCLTVIVAGQDVFEVEAVEETLAKSTLGDLKSSSHVNLELPVRMADRLGGHLVLGHVDCVGIVNDVIEQASSRLITVDCPPEFSRYLVPVGSVALDGISLTIAEVRGSRFTVSIIPHTLEKTTVAGARRGSRVNLEFDIIGKYIEKLLSPDGLKGQGKISADRLRQWGYDV